jgi:hypothetical protein
MFKLAVGPTQPLTHGQQGYVSHDYTGQSVQQTSHIHLVLRLIELGAIPQLPHMPS